MGSSTTPPATGEAGAPRRALPSPALVIAGKLVLGLAGLAGCALLGAGGALLAKHLMGSDRPAVQGPPLARTPVSPVPPAASAALPAAPAPPVLATTPAPEASVAVLVQAAPASAAVASAHDDASAEAPIQSRYEQLQPPAYGTASPSHAAAPEGHVKTTHADKAACLARVNAITADLSLRSEPPTPEQLAILKRGCK